MKHSISAFDFATATRIIFGAGKLRDAGPIARELGRRALVVIGKSAGAIQRVEPLLAALMQDGVEYATFSVAGEPTIDVVRAGTARARDERCELVIGFGGGSAIDTAKGIAILLKEGGKLEDYQGFQMLNRKVVPHLCIPTTAGTGSEVTYAAVIKDHEKHQKLLFGDHHIIPDVAILDPVLTVGLPPLMTAARRNDATASARW